MQATSRLKMAWLVLIGAMIALVIAAILAPAPRSADTGVTFDLPESPDRYAQGNGDEASDGADIGLRRSAQPSADDEALPKVVFAPQPDEQEPADDGEVVITISGSGGDGRSAVASSNAIPPKPLDDALTAQTPSGRRPAIGADGRTPFSAYRRLEPVGTSRGVAVIVSGLGLDTALTDAAIALPPAISLAFAPYGKDLPTQIERARLAGHEVMIELPMGTPGVAPAALGPAGLLSERSPAANDKRTEWLLTRAPAYPMVTNYLGTGFARDEAALARLMRTISRTGVAYIDDTGQAESAARFAGVPYGAVATLIEPDTDDVTSRLNALAKRAASGEVSLAKVYAKGDAMDDIAAWARALPVDTALVPASTAVTAR